MFFENTVILSHFSIAQRLQPLGYGEMDSEYRDYYNILYCVIPIQTKMLK
jgi:hypothetical protein